MMPSPAAAATAADSFEPIDYKSDQQILAKQFNNKYYHAASH